MAALEAKDVRFTHPGSSAPALDGATFAVAEGSFTGLLGPNGAGKTTFVNLVCGLLRPSGGSLDVFGTPADAADARSAIGFCPQELALYPTLTARENLLLFARLARVPGARVGERADACLAAARLVNEANTRVERFSGGMKRRLNLAVALVHEPRMLVLDEPTVGVDAQSRLAIFETLEELHTEGATIVYTTHYMEEVERLCGDVVVIDRGRVIAQGKTAELARRGLGGHRIVATPRTGSSIAATKSVAVRALDDGRVELRSNELAPLSARVAELTASGDVTAIESRPPSLEERFLALTGEELRDG